MTKDTVQAGAGGWRARTERKSVASPGTPPDHVNGGGVAAQRPSADLEQSQRLETLGVLSGTITHDFNNVLGVILGNARLARAALPVDSPAQALLAEIELAAGHGADLTTQLRCYAGKSDFVSEPVELSELVRELQPLLRLAVSKRVSLSLSLTDDLPSVQADPTQLRQVVLNLATNASEAIDGSGTVTITTGRVSADLAYLAGFAEAKSLVAGDYVVLEVIDTGAGMTRRTKGRIFEPFFSTKGAGRGFGLAALKGIVSRHRGAIKVLSDPLRGTTFTTILPAC